MDGSINFLVLWVGTKCTLNCKNCACLIPHLKQESFDSKKIVENIRFITKSVSIQYLQIQGGEPLTHEDLPEIVQDCCDLPIELVEIASNGTVVPSEKLVSILKNNVHKVRFRVSDYACVSEGRKNQILTLMKNNGINCDSYAFRFGDHTWLDYGDADSKYSEEGVLSYSSCPNRKCWVLADDYLAVCGKISSLRKMKPHNFSETDDNIVNVTDLRLGNCDFSEALKVFKEAYHSHPPASCGWCPAVKAVIPAAIQR